jgi:N-acetyl sugar amidotransferase
MNEIIWCKNCILPNSRPNLDINKETNLCNVCNPIINNNYRIDWKKRKKEFQKIIKKIKKNNPNYHCLIPVSGGKDSTWQVLTALKFNLRPLCITWKSPARNLIGQKNLDNLVNLGVDHIDVTIDPKLEKYFICKTLKKFGNPLIPMHMALHAITVKTAIEKKIKLILWGENSADEYGGKKDLKGKYMTNHWRKYYGVNNGTDITFWFDKKINKKNSNLYQIPKHKEIKKNNIKEIFLGYYFKWDPKKIFKIAKKNGFKNLKKPKTGIYNFADIDDAFLITIHHFMKWYKFGFSRIWDNLSIEIRNKRLSRDNALLIARKLGNEKPIKEIHDFCRYLNITNSEFFRICNSFRNKKIWFKDHDKIWKIKNFPIKNWVWE